MEYFPQFHPRRLTHILVKPLSERDKMGSNFNRLVKTFTLVLVLLTSVNVFTQVKANIPVTADPIPAAAVIDTATTKSSLMALTDFMAAVKDGKAGVRGVYVPDVMAFRVIQQPKDQNGYVSAIQGLVTQFGMASDYGTIGLLAHNFAAGSEFSRVLVGSKVSVIYGDGTIKNFKVSKIARYQALQPNSSSSNFQDLETNEKLSAGSLFKVVYSGKAHLTLQTCIAQGKESSWGRLFIIAEPVE